jgi:hypothetical protein
MAFGEIKTPFSELGCPPAALSNRHFDRMSVSVVAPPRNKGETLNTG